MYVYCVYSCGVVTNDISGPDIPISSIISLRAEGKWRRKTQGQRVAEVCLLFVAVAVSDYDVAFDVVADFDIDHAIIIIIIISH